MSALALGLTSFATPTDEAVSQTLARLFGLTASNIGFFNSSWTSRLANLVVLTMVAFGAECVGFKLSGVPKRIGMMQVFVAGLFGLSFLLYLKLSITALSSLVAIILGYVSGNFFRVYDQKEQRNESMFYELKLANRELQETRLFLAKQDEVDRRLLAADLHDQVLNDLKQVSERIKSLKTHPREDTAREVEKLLQQSMKAVREVMESLSPSLIEHLSFAATIEDCLRSAATRGSFKVKFKCLSPEEDLDKMSSVEKILLYRLIQECCNNVCKHAQASELKVFITSEEIKTSKTTDKHFLLRFIDNGRGMSIADVDPKSRGLQYMRQRAQLIGASIVWLPGPENKGTCVEIRWSPAAAEQTKSGT